MFVFVFSLAKAECKHRTDLTLALSLVSSTISEFEKRKLKATIIRLTQRRWTNKKKFICLNLKNKGGAILDKNQLEIKLNSSKVTQMMSSSSGNYTRGKNDGRRQLILHVKLECGFDSNLIIGCDRISTRLVKRTWRAVSSQKTLVCLTFAWLELPSFPWSVQTSLTCQVREIFLNFWSLSFFSHRPGLGPWPLAGHFLHHYWPAQLEQLPNRSPLANHRRRLRSHTSSQPGLSGRNSRISHALRQGRSGHSFNAHDTTNSQEEPLLNMSDHHVRDLHFDVLHCFHHHRWRHIHHK